ncbi:hypothetical protein KCG44_13965, partial [Pacificimonas sp. WHA3]
PVRHPEMNEIRDRFFENGFSVARSYRDFARAVDKSSVSDKEHWSEEVRKQAILRSPKICNIRHLNDIQCDMAAASKSHHQP